jgi:hypothetical protein
MWRQRNYVKHGKFWTGFPTCNRNRMVIKERREPREKALEIASLCMMQRLYGNITLVRVYFSFEKRGKRR